MNRILLQRQRGFVIAVIVVLLLASFGAVAVSRGANNGDGQLSRWTSNAIGKGSIPMSVVRWQGGPNDAGAGDAVAAAPMLVATPPATAVAVAPANVDFGKGDADTPRGLPLDLNRTDWVLTQDFPQHMANEGVGGLDLAFRDVPSSYGSPLHATMRGIAGVVADRGDGTGYGNAVYLYGYVNPDTGKSYNLILGHFQKIYIADGQSINPADVFGEMGSTGWSTGPHVHYELFSCQMPTSPAIALGTINRNLRGSCQTIDPAPFALN